jgi:D-glycero-D-manno-heptose 1,7-bisphosphate phosphatase
MIDKCFFLDRDGTLNVDYDYVHKPSEWTWCDGALDALVLLKERGYKLAVITNQSGIARGRFTMEQVNRLHQWVNDQLLNDDIAIDGFYVAPWHPDYHEGRDPALLEERKPGTALFRKAAEELGITLDGSCMAGDKISDILPALHLNMKPYLIRSRFYTEEIGNWCRQHHIPVFDRLIDAVEYELSAD